MVFNSYTDWNYTLIKVPKESVINDLSYSLQKSDNPQIHYKPIKSSAIIVGKLKSWFLDLWEKKGGTIPENIIEFDELIDFHLAVKLEQSDFKNLEKYMFELIKSYPEYYEEKSSYLGYLYGMYDFETVKVSLSNKAKDIFFIDKFLTEYKHHKLFYSYYESEAKENSLAIYFTKMDE